MQTTFRLSTAEYQSNAAESSWFRHPLATLIVHSSGQTPRRKRETSSSGHPWVDNCLSFHMSNDDYLTRQLLGQRTLRGCGSRSRIGSSMSIPSVIPHNRCRKTMSLHIGVTLILPCLSFPYHAADHPALLLWHPLHRSYWLPPAHYFYPVHRHLLSWQPPARR